MPNIFYLDEKKFKQKLDNFLKCYSLPEEILEELSEYELTIQKRLER